jgi:hypothetical protein
MKIILPFAIIGGLILGFFGLRKFYLDYTEKGGPGGGKAATEQVSSPAPSPGAVSTRLALVHSERPGHLVHAGISYRDGQLSDSGVVTVARDIANTGSTIIVDPDRHIAEKFCSYSVHSVHGPVVGICNSHTIFEYWKGRKTPRGVVLSVSPSEVVLLSGTGSKIVLFPL